MNDVLPTACLADARRMSESDFAAAYTHPFLLVRLSAADEDLEYRTVVAARHADLSSESFLAPVIKRDGANSFSFISIGRSRNNDIVVNANSVSKSHAFIEHRDGRYTITDAGSRNGTMIDGRPVERRVAAELRMGALIQLSPRVTAELIDARRAHAWLRANGREAAGPGILAG